jgi:cytoskeletal protein RodZ
MEIPTSGEVLKWAREFRGLSLDEAAERLGLPIDELKAFEAGRKQL